MLLAGSDEWLEVAAPVGVEVWGCISTKPKQNNDTTNNGGPIRKRWEAAVCGELFNEYCVKLAPFKPELF